jgi:Fe-S cluster biosynthesis and repair protein YggX
MGSSEFEIQCHRCGGPGTRLPSPPFKGERGLRIQENICRSCWADWLKHQTALINHYGLDPREASARDFLYGQIDQVLLGDEPEISPTTD